jgi:hypothetical protein
LGNKCLGKIQLCVALKGKLQAAHEVGIAETMTSADKTSAVEKGLGVSKPQLRISITEKSNPVNRQERCQSYVSCQSLGLQCISQTVHKALLLPLRGNRLFGPKVE